jgi:hypothetical protein
MASSSSGIVAIGRLTLKTEVILQFLTPEVSPANSPDTTPENDAPQQVQPWRGADEKTIIQRT